MVRVGMCVLDVAEVYIEAIETDRPGMGHGSRALRAICRWADDNNINLSLTVGAFSHRFLPEEILIEWYRKFDFKRSFGSKYNLVRKVNGVTRIDL